MDVVKVKSDYAIAPDASVVAYDLANLHLLHERLRANDELSEALTRLNNIFIEIKKTEVAQAIVKGILDSRRKYGQ